MSKLIPKAFPSYPRTFEEMYPTRQPPMFDKTYIDANAWAEQILDKASLPYDLALIEDRGFREGKDIEWYAGAIIRHWNYIHIVWMGGIPQYDGGRDHVVFHGRIQTMESLTKELDRLISKAEILDDPHSRRSHKAGKGRGKQQTEAQKMEWAKWQVEADKVWKKQPTWGTPAVARKIHRQFPDVEEDTIRKRIKKPK